MTARSTSIPFTKMQGAGNDFIVIDNRDATFSEDEIIACTPAACDRRFGIGADGVMLLQQNSDPSLDYTMFYRNADGSDAGMCGNGARCLALYAHSLELGDRFQFNVHENVYTARVDAASQQVSIHFPMQVSIRTHTVEEQTVYQAHAGTEHLVLPTEAAELENETSLITQGRHLRYHEAFDPPGTNVNFIHGEGASIQLQTYERGVEDLTLACGTGAIASAITWHHLHPDAGNTIRVETKGGTLSVTFTYNKKAKEYAELVLTGEAAIVFEGRYPR